jgi:hypothetical protein
MKGKYFGLFIPLIFVSCQKNTLDTSDLADNLNRKAQHLDLKASIGDSKYRMLGFSYDVTREYLDKDSYRRAVIDVEKLSDELRFSVIVNPETGGTNQYYYGYSSSDYLRDVTTKTNATAKVDPGATVLKKVFTGNITSNNELTTKYSYSTKFAFASIDAAKYVSSLRIEETPIIMSNYVTSKFISDLETLNPDDFVEAYGTHVLTDITLGGVLRVLYKSSSTDQSNTTNKTNTVKAGFKAILPKIGLGLDIDKTVATNETLSSQNINKQLFIKYKGGEGVDVTFSEGKDATYPQINKATWERSVNTNNAGLVNINWGKTYPIYDFIPAALIHKKAAIIAAVNRYIDKNQLQPLEVVPIYQWYNTRSAVYAYTPNLDGNFGPNYINHGIAFWAPKEAGNKTVPVNQWHNTRNGFYAYSPNPSANFGANYTNHGRSFFAYASNDNDPDLTAIYQWYNTKTGTYAYGPNTTQNHGMNYVNHGVAFNAYGQ